MMGMMEKYDGGQFDSMSGHVTSDHYWFLRAPETQADWNKVANAFDENWNFHNCLAAIDGKHVSIQCPPRHSVPTTTFSAHHDIQCPPRHSVPTTRRKYCVDGSFECK